jgi:hypothetical protein
MNLTCSSLGQNGNVQRNLAYVPWLLVAAMMVSFSSSSRAEIVVTTSDLQSHAKTSAYLFSKPMLDTMYRLGLEQDTKFGLHAGCISQSRVKPVESLVLAPIDFPDDRQNPIKGAWFSRYRLERCSESKLYNVLFIANSDGSAPLARTYYPGATIAGPELVNDAMPSVVSGALARSGLKDCKDIDVFDMRVSEPVHDVVEAGKTIRGVWEETWTLRMCGQMHEVAVTFIPDTNGSGATFTSGPVNRRRGSIN